MSDEKDVVATPLARDRHRCKASSPEGVRCRLYLGHDGKHGAGEGTVWNQAPDWTGANTVRKAWERSPLLRSVKAARTKCQTCGGRVEVRAGELVCVSGSYLPHPAARVIPPGNGGASC